ncbi:MAG: hypothetical protein ABSA23_06950 [Anaerolineales bacterium]|jgi:hypothetical protein
MKKADSTPVGLPLQAVAEADKPATYQTKDIIWFGYRELSNLKMDYQDMTIMS